MDFKDTAEETLRLRLKSTEHDFVERKAKKDKGGWLQTAVAFANSAPIGWPAVLFVGVTDDGKPQLEAADLEAQINSISDVLEGAYPAIYRYIVPLHLSDGCCLAVIIPGSAERPHFAGKSYVRLGGATKPASEQQFAELIAYRSSKARMILEWKGREVVLELVRNRGTLNIQRHTAGSWILSDCNQFFLSLQRKDGSFRTISLARVELGMNSDQTQLTIEYEE